MYCKKCGSKLFGDEEVCPYCGEPIDQKESKEDIVSKRLSILEENKTVREEIDAINKEYSFSAMKEEKVEDPGSIWYAVLGYFVPIVGFILFLVWKNEKPKSAKQAGIGALISFVLNLVCIVPIVCCIVGSSFNGM